MSRFGHDLLAFAITGVLLGGCATSPETAATPEEDVQTTDAVVTATPVEDVETTDIVVLEAAEPGAQPEDFALDVIVLPSSRVPRRGPVEHRASRYVLFADGTLHVGAIDRGLPPRVRTLHERDLDAVWGLSDDVGLLAPAAREAPGNPELERPPASGVKYVVTVTAAGERWMRHYVDDADDAAGVQLVRALAALAWMSDEPEVRRLTIPRRYDFGPDPYERYAPPPPIVTPPDAPSDAAEPSESPEPPAP
jgi:hypothetical protein